MRLAGRVARTAHKKERVKHYTESLKWNRSRRNDNVKVNLRETVYENENWIQLDQDRVQWLAPVNTVKDPRVSKMRGISWLAERLSASPVSPLVNGYSCFYLWRTCSCITELSLWCSRWYSGYRGWHWNQGSRVRNRLRTIKICSTTSFGGEAKPSATCKILLHVKYPAELQRYYVR
jgi:hypothetical protein